MEVFETNTTVQYVEKSETPDFIEDVYSINVPENFILNNNFESEIYVSSVYRTQEDDYIFFNQYVKSKYDVNVNTEDRPLDYIEINGNDWYVVELGNNEYYISWDNGDYIFDITGNIGKSTLIDAANSV